MNNLSLPVTNVITQYFYAEFCLLKSSLKVPTCLWNKITVDLVLQSTTSFVGIEKVIP